MSKVTKTADASGNHIGYMFFCPACNEHHGPSTSWQFNGDMDRPTFSPSILVRGKPWPTEDELRRIKNGEVIDFPDTVCHSFVVDGKIQYLSDCTHDLAGQTIDLPELEE